MTQVLHGCQAKLSSALGLHLRQIPTLATVQCPDILPREGVDKNGQEIFKTTSGVPRNLSLASVSIHVTSELSWKSTLQATCGSEGASPAVASTCAATWMQI
eukprot:592174-Amphidinium_carterae.1